jgi:hypothetical protein
MNYEYGIQGRLCPGCTEGRIQESERVEVTGGGSELHNELIHTFFSLLFIKY